MRRLFVTWSGAGNQWPALGLAEAMTGAGELVAVAGAADQRALFEGRGFAFHELHPALDYGDGGDAPTAHKAASWANPDHPAALDSLICASRPDELVIDCLMFAALAAAERCGIPSTVLVHSAPDALVPAGGGLERLLLGDVNRLREQLRLGCLAHLQDAWGPFTTVAASLEALNPGQTAPGRGVHYIGPIRPREPEAWASPWAFSDERPLVLASFSTGRAWNQASRIARTAQALDGLDVRGLFTIGLAEAPADAPDNCVFVPHAPHCAVLAQAKAVVTHAGHGTLLAALCAGLPVVCLPNQGADQVALSRHVARAGAGIALDGDMATPGEIREALKTVLTDPAYGKRAKALGATAFGKAGMPAGVSGILEPRSSGGWR